MNAATRHSKPAAALLVATLAVAIYGCAGPAARGVASAPPGTLPKVSADLERVRAGLDKYRDWQVAVHDGYFSTVGCVDYPQGGMPGHVPYPPGGMGVHFFNGALIGPQLDPMRPQVLVYEHEGETLRLVAAEWFVPLAVGIKDRPTLFGRPFDGPMEGHYPLMPAGMHHYDLHVWLWKENPAGLFAPTNPDVSCRGAPFALHEAAPKIVPHGPHATAK